MAPSDDELDESLTVLPVVVEPPTDGDLADGVAAGSFVIREKIGRGGCGTVYMAEHREDKRLAAVKVLHRFLAADAHSVERFMREVRAVDRIQHPAIVDVYEVGRLPDERPFFVMELLAGINLRRLLQREGRLSPIEAYEILEQVCGALEAAHAAGIVHRDVKPENVIVGSDRNIKLVDFGVAKLTETDPSAPGLTTTQQVLGTLVAMAPEQIRCQKIDQRTDIYGLGTLLYNMLTGVYPFRGPPEELMRMHLETPPRPPSSLTLLSPAIDAVVLRCLEKDPAARYPTAGAVLAAFRAAVFGEAAPLLVRTGLGLLVRTAPAADDEDALADAALALDAAEGELRGAGYAIALLTSSEVLGVLVAAGSAAAESARHRDAIELAYRLHERLAAQSGPGVKLAVTLHADEVHLREGSGEVAGGPLLEIGAWARPHEGVLVTSRARGGG
jgi:serine/threonine-protein kinase